MRQESVPLPPAEGPPVLATNTGGAGVLGASGTAAAQANATVALRELRLPRGRALSLPRAIYGPTAGRAALATLILGMLALVVFDAAGPSVLVPRSNEVFAAWEAGPLHGVFGTLSASTNAVNYSVSALLIVMLLAYGVALAAVRALSMRAIVVCVVALHAILLLEPPFQLTDLFNYLGYARLGALHGLNPYTHVIGQEMHDPVYHLSNWSNLHSPYGELFTALSYPLAWLPLPVAYWIVKVVTVLMSLGLIALVWDSARRLGRDPRFAVAIVALNPVYFVYAIGGFHNDFFMLVPSTAAIALLLARRDRAAGAALMLAVGLKFTAVLLLPFLLVAARPARGRREVLVGAALTAVPLVVLSVALFGFSLPNLSQQGSLLTPFSIPNLFGYVIGAGGGTTFILRLADVALVVAIVVLVRRRGDWLTHAGWAMVALIASLAWLMPWYVIWMLPLVALASSVRLRRAAGVLTVFVVLTFMPVNSTVFGWLNFVPTRGAAWQASQTLQTKLYSYHEQTPFAGTR
jgi:alpha-1,6-mannosyltransferase